MNWEPIVFVTVGWVVCGVLTYGLAYADQESRVFATVCGLFGPIGLLGLLVEVLVTGGGRCGLRYRTRSLPKKPEGWTAQDEHNFTRWQDRSRTMTQGTTTDIARSQFRDEPFTRRSDMQATVELYRPPMTGTALAEDRATSAQVDLEAYALELTEKRKAATALGLLPHVVKRCEGELLRVSLQRTIGYPLMTDEEQHVWRAYLPTTYTTKSAPMMNGVGFRPGTRSMEQYAFDLPPVSVLEFWQAEKAVGLFDVYEIWTQEVVPVDPILVAYREDVGPFLLARWGEALKPFAEIKQAVQARIGEKVAVREGMRQFQLQQLSLPPTGGLFTGLTWGSTSSPDTTTSGTWTPLQR